MDNTTPRNTPQTSGVSHASRHGAPRRHAGVTPGRVVDIVAGTLGELLLLIAIVCGLYIAWQLWWTGEESEQTQTQTLTDAAWSAPRTNSDGSYAIAPAQSADTAPALTTQPAADSLIGQIFIPRFGSSWNRTIIQGTELRQLNTGGLGHYTTSGMPGAVGNFAVAGHRAGYGNPLGDVDKLQEGDAIVIRTADYWYVYMVTSHEIVLPTQSDVIDPVPHEPNATPTQRLITLTTCHPRLQNPTHRWIVYGQLASWSRVSDGVPQEIATAADQSSGTLFTRTQTRVLGVIPASTVRDLPVTCRALLLAYLVVWLAAAIAWRWPALRRRGKSGAYDDAGSGAGAGFGGAGGGGFGADGADAPTATSTTSARRPTGLFVWLVRLQPGVLPIRIVLVVILVLAAVAALFQWVFPWAASTIPYLRLASNYVPLE